MRSIHLLGKDTAAEWRLVEELGGAPNKFFPLAQRIAWGITQPDLIRVDLTDTARRLVASHGTAFPAHLFSAWVWRARDPERAERDLETARRIATADHPLAYLLPTAAEWTMDAPAQQLVEIHPGRMWRVAHAFPLVGAPLHFNSIATIIRTTSGDLAICNPVGFADAIAKSIAELGPVRWILAQGKGHSAFIEPARRRFHGALSIASQGHLRHPPASHLEVDGILGKSRLPGELALIPIDGHLFEEVMILDRPSRTLISQDVVAFSADERTFPSRLYTFAFGLVDPLGFPSYSWMLWQNVTALHKSLDALRDADFDHVIAAHGPIAPRRDDGATLRAAIEHARGISPLAHKALLARYFATQPTFLRDLVRYLKASKGKLGARLRETTASDA